MMEKQLFDNMPDKYTAWFKTPIGKLVMDTEKTMTLGLLKPTSGDVILDVGCGSGIFTEFFIDAGADVIGLDISVPMIRDACVRLQGKSFSSIAGTMYNLPFDDECFDKTVSITALEFVPDAQRAVDEMFRVTKPGGWIVVSTLNSLSSWAERRTKVAEVNKQSIFREAYFRSPDELRGLSSEKGLLRTVVHFSKHEDPSAAEEQEYAGIKRGVETGAYVIIAWKKPTS